MAPNQQNQAGTQQQRLQQCQADCRQHCDHLKKCCPPGCDQAAWNSIIDALLQMLLALLQAIVPQPQPAPTPPAAP